MKTWTGQAWLPSCRIVHKLGTRGFCPSTGQQRNKCRDKNTHTCSRNGSRIGIMFERFTEQARCTIFFARYEASQFGSTQIESEHLLLGLIREDETLTYGLLSVEARKNICLAVESHSKDSTILSVNIDLPLSRECVQILKNAAEQADQHSNNHIGTEHLLLALLGMKTCLAAELLNRCGITTERMLQSLKKAPSTEHPKTERPKRRASNPPPWSWPDAT